MKTKHRHPCRLCGASVPCAGEWERNPDGYPEVICSHFHLPGGVHAVVLCEACDTRERERARIDALENSEEPAYAVGDCVRVLHAVRLPKEVEIGRGPIERITERAGESLYWVAGFPMARTARVLRPVPA